MHSEQVVQDCRSSPPVSPPRGSGEEFVDSVDTPRSLINRIIADVARDFGIPVYEILGPSRVTRVVRARWRAMRAIKCACPHLSTVRIGEIFGRDHATVLHALKSTRWR